MRHLLLALLLAAQTAHAEDLATLETFAGGEIVLTNLPRTEGGNIAYEREHNGDTKFGTWLHSGRMIVITWDGLPGIKMFEPSRFTPLTDVQEAVTYE
jgi:hypothetical protein